MSLGNSSSDKGALLRIIVFIAIVVVLYLVFSYIIPALELWWHNTVVFFDSFIESLFHLVVVGLILVVLFVFIWFIAVSVSRSNRH